ncbi:MAG: NAD(P)-dependent oxidoreductase [Candidatus Aenigmarchaeota archaeon]|nr:NAD(P)-dependent oxidoreductase [Candidatus Aenigmarchaeota archaeon]
MLLVTGATGFLGSSVMRAIASGRRDVRILSYDYEAAKTMYPQFDVVKGDITRPQSLKGIGKNVDTIIHLAGIVSYTKPKDELFEINVEGTKNMLEACDASKKIIFASSVSVYGEIPASKGPASENYPTRPANLYGWSKLEAERLIADSGMKYVVLRIAPVYGAGSPQWFRNLSLLEKGFPIPKTRNLTHVAHISNVAQAFALALKPRAEGIYNIADEKPVAFTEFASELVTLLGGRPKLMPGWLVGLGARAKGMKAYLDVLTINRNYDISSAKKQLGYRPKVEFNTELKKMINWYLDMKQKPKEKEI